MLQQYDYPACDDLPASGVLQGIALALSGIEGATLSAPVSPVIELQTNPPTRVPIPLGHEAEGYQYGFQAAVHAVLDALVGGGRPLHAVNILPGLVAAADVRCLLEIVTAFGIPPTALPDFSARAPLTGDTLLRHGTPLAEIARMGRARATLEFGRIRFTACTGGQLLRERYAIPWYRLPLPVGLASTDKLFRVLAKLTDRPIPKQYRAARRQLTEAYDADRRHLTGRQVALYGDDTTVAALTAFLYEVEMEPVLCASEGKSGQLAEIVHYGAPDLLAATPVLEGAAYSRVATLIKRQPPQLLIGSPTLRPLAHELGLPFIQAGFPFTTAQPSYFGYPGTLLLFERLVELLW